MTKSKLIGIWVALRILTACIEPNKQTATSIATNESSQIQAVSLDETVPTETSTTPMQVVQSPESVTAMPTTMDTSTGKTCCVCLYQESENGCKSALGETECKGSEGCRWDGAKCLSDGCAGLGKYRCSLNNICSWQPINGSPDLGICQSVTRSSCTDIWAKNVNRTVCGAVFVNSNLQLDLRDKASVDQFSKANQCTSLQVTWLGHGLQMATDGAASVCAACKEGDNSVECTGCSQFAGGQGADDVAKKICEDLKKVGFSGTYTATGNQTFVPLGDLGYGTPMTITITSPDPCTYTVSYGTCANMKPFACELRTRGQSYICKNSTGALETYKCDRTGLFYLWNWYKI